MSKLEVPKKIRTEDFNADQADFISKLGFIFNTFSDQVYQILNNGVDFDNLRRQVVTLDVTMSATGSLSTEYNIKYNLNSKLKGINVLDAKNINNSNVYPTSHPFVSWSLNGNLVKVLNISGLQNSSQYRLTLELVG